MLIRPFEVRLKYLVISATHAKSCSRRRRPTEADFLAAAAAYFRYDGADFFVDDPTWMERESCSILISTFFAGKPNFA